MAKTPSPEKRKKPSLLEQYRQFKAELVAAKTKGHVQSAFELLDLKFRNARGQANPEEVAKLEAIRREAGTLVEQTEAKIDATVEEGPRFKVKSGSVNEAAKYRTDPEKNQDAKTQDDQAQLYGVYDGVGGNAAGEKAARLAKDVIERELSNLPADTSLEDTTAAVAAALKKANAAIVQLSENQGKPVHMRTSTTAVVMKIYSAAAGKRTAVIGHAGDSRAYVRKQDGRVIQLTVDHNLIEEFRLSGSLDEADARAMSRKHAEVIDPDNELDERELSFYENNNTVTKALADDTLDPTMTMYELEEGDQLLLTSDGISDLVPHSNIETTFNLGTDPDDIAQRLLADANRPVRRGPNGKVDDDKTAIVVQWEDVLQREISAHVAAYKAQIEAGGELTVPYTVVDQAAFRQLVEANHPGWQDLFTNQYDDSAEAEWRKAGAGDWIDRLTKLREIENADTRVQELFALSRFEELPGNAAERAAVQRYFNSLRPDALLALINDLTDYLEKQLEHGNNRLVDWQGLQADLDNELTEIFVPDATELDDRRLRSFLLDWRRRFMVRDSESDFDRSDNSMAAFGRLREEVLNAGQEGDLQILVRNICRRIPHARDFFERAGVGDYLTDLGIQREDNPVATRPSTAVVAPERAVLYEAQARLLHRQGQLAGDLTDHLAALPFMDSAHITAETALADQLNKLVERLVASGTGDLTSATLTALPECQQLAHALALSVEDVAQAVITQKQLLLEQAAQRERSERTIKTQLAKAAVYLGAGVALTASAVVAPWAAVGVLAGARLVDRLISHKLQSDKQTKYFEESLATLRQPDQAQKVVANIAARLSARKRELLASKTQEQVSTTDLRNAIIEQFSTRCCLQEAADLFNAQMEYDAAPDDQRYRNYLDKRRILEEKMEPYVRAAQGHAAMFELDNQMMDTEAKLTKQSSTWIDKHPKISAVLGYKNERIAEKFASAAFFTAAGVAAREWLPVRIALAAYAGARAGEALMTYAINSRKAREVAQAEYLGLTTAALNEIDLTNTDEAQRQLAYLVNAVGDARIKLSDTKFKRQQPIQYEQLLQLVRRYEQLYLTLAAQYAMVDIARKNESNSMSRYAGREIKQSTIDQWARRLGIFGTAVGGGMLALLIHNAAELLQQQPSAQPPEPEAVPVVLPGVQQEPVPTPAASTPQEIPVAAPEPPPAPVEPEATAVPEPVQSPAPELAPEPAPVVEIPSDHVVIGHDKGVSHGLVDKMTRSEMKQLLHDTKITIGGREVALVDTGVSKADTLEIGVGTQDGHKVVEFYDATTHERISDDRLDEYLYDRGVVHEEAELLPDTTEPEPAGSPAEPVRLEAEGVVEPSAAAVQAVGPSEPVIIEHGVDRDYDFRQPQVGTETSTDYIRAGLRDYVAHDDAYPALDALSDDELMNRPELAWLHENLKVEYREAGQAAAEASRPVLAEPVPAPSVQVTAETVSTYVDAKGQLTPAGLQELNLTEHISTTGSVQNFADFKKDIVTLLDAAKQDRITTPNRLVFEERAGELYVDVAGGDRDAYRVDDQLYGQLMEHYQTVVKPKSDGVFTRKEFYTVLDEANTEHKLHAFEIERMNLNAYFTDGRAEPYDEFSRDMKEFMRVHAVTRFTGQNGLVFKLDDNQLGVDVAGGLARTFPLTPELYERLMERYQALGYDYHEKFDVDQFYSVVENK